MRCRIPIVYLVDSAGVFLPMQHGTFPGKYGGARIFHNCSRMRRILKIPQFSAVMGHCIAGGAYLPALSDVILMGGGNKLHGPRRAEPRQGRHRTGRRCCGPRPEPRSIPPEAAWPTIVPAPTPGALRSFAISYWTCPGPPRIGWSRSDPDTNGGADEVLPRDRRLPYDIHSVLRRVVDRNGCVEFMRDYSPELLCANVRIEGWPVGLIANRRGLFRSQGKSRGWGDPLCRDGSEGRRVRPQVRPPRACARLPAGRDGIHGRSRGGAQRHYPCRRGNGRVHVDRARAKDRCYAGGTRAGRATTRWQGRVFEPDFIFSWPSARVGVMEGESAVQALFAREFAQACRLRRRGSRRPAASHRKDSPGV